MSSRTSESATWRRIWRYVVPIGVIAASAMTARAFDTSWIAPNQPISSSSLKADLDELHTRLAVLESGSLGYPAVIATPAGNTFCGPAPTSFSVATDATSYTAAFGQLLTTSEGAFAVNPGQPFPASCTNGTPNYCYGPITFFLNNPNAAKTISIETYADDGPSYIYVDGNLGANKFLSPPIGAAITAVNVSIPTGAFALSYVACSNNGPSVNLRVHSKFITANLLTLDYDRTLHRNGM